MGSKDNENSYRSILKGTSLLGGVQLFQILISLIRGKFVALFLGPAGMGVSSLFNTSGNTIQQLAGLGLNLAIVREVAAVKENPGAIQKVLAITHRLVLLTALLGAVICFLLSGFLSRLTFDSDEYTWQFMLLSAMVFFGVAGQGYLSILQGIHELKKLSRATLIGSVTGLATGVPLYYFFGTKGIVPAMVILAFTLFLCYFLDVRKSLPSIHTPFLWQEHKPIAKKLVTMGIILMASNLLGAAVQYLVNLFVRTYGALEDVGFYQAANSLTNQYAGLVFASMMMDFFPRLAAAAEDNRKICSIVNHQLEIISLITAPMVCILIVGTPLAVDLLLTSDFISVVPLIRWFGLGVLIRAIMYPLGYIAFAKGNRKLFFWMEGIAFNLLTLCLSCILYHFFGLIGLSYSLIFDCSICFVVYYIVNHRLYSYSIDHKAILECLMAVLFGVSCLWASLCPDSILSWVFMSLIMVLSSAWSFFGLRKRFRNSKGESVIDDSAATE